MKIAFWFTTNKKFKFSQWEDTPFGGCEIEALHLARELHSLYASYKNKWPVMIFANIDDNGGINNHGLFFNHEDFAYAMGRFGIDVLIVVRAHDAILSPRKNQNYFVNGKPRLTILWSGDSYDQPNNELLYDKFAVDDIDKIILKGIWQEVQWLECFSKIKRDKIEVINKGLNVEWLTNERSNCTEPRFIYASTAFRGMSNFIKIWPLIKRKIPEATLDCYCKTTLYDEAIKQDEYSDLYRTLSSFGVTIKEPIPQKEFFKVLPNYYAMLYPNTGFEETVCGVALEAMASGVPVITTARAGLIETINAGNSILIEESENYVQDFADYVHGLWMDKKSREEISVFGFDRIRESYSIKKKALQWKALIDGLVNDDPVDSYIIGSLQENDMVSA